LPENEDKKPLIREVSSEDVGARAEEEKKVKHIKVKDGLPALPFKKPPKPPSLPEVPGINPLVQQALDQPLTLADCQYILNNLRPRIVRRLEELRKEHGEQEVIPASENVREMQATIDILTDYLTKGFTVEYTPPTQMRAQAETEGDILSRLNDFWALLDRFNPELKKKFGDFLGGLFDLFMEKVGKR